ncbi:MAG: 3D domain-containing protein [Acidobacteria bacterium]|nr:3D domain-containing protein [Acidobacteriota bacterium]
MLQKGAVTEANNAGAEMAETTDAAEDGAAVKEAEAAPPSGTKAAIDITKTGAETEASSPAVTFTATAYSLRGRTANGSAVRRGIIAADRRVLPLGTRVRLEAGSYSGEYIVTDTGGAVCGRKIDIWVPQTSEAMRFGRRPVRLTVLTRTRPRTVTPQSGK